MPVTDPLSHPAARSGLRAAAVLTAVASLGLAGCGGGDGSSGEIAVETAGPVADVSVSQSGGQLVVRWEQTADSAACALDYELASGESGSRSFGSVSAVPVVEQVFDVPGEVVSATLACT